MVVREFFAREVDKSIFRKFLVTMATVGSWGSFVIRYWKGRFRARFML